MPNTVRTEAGRRVRRRRKGEAVHATLRPQQPLKWWPSLFDRAMEPLGVTSSGAKAHELPRGLGRPRARVQETYGRSVMTPVHNIGAALLVAVQLLLVGVAVAHEGHDHDTPPPLNLPVAPRVVAVTPDYELVGVLSGEHRLTIFLHRFETGEPVKDAKIFVSAGEQEVEAVRKEDGVFDVSAPWISAAEPMDIALQADAAER